MFGIGIVAHTARVKAAKRLAREVRADFLSIDNGIMGCEANHDAVQHHLSALPSTWSVILEDDAEPVEQFRWQLHQALVTAPAPIVSLYIGRQRPPWAQEGIATAIAEAQAQQADWLVGTHLLHAVGYCIKTELLPSLLKFPPTPLPADQHISRWAQTYGYLIANAYPSLVDHQDGPTVIERHPDGQPRTPGRVAWKTAHHPDWSTRSVTLRTP